MKEGSGAGSVLVTNGSGCGSGRPKNIRIPNTDHNYKYSRNPVLRSSILNINDMSRGIGESPHSVDADKGALLMSDPDPDPGLKWTLKLATPSEHVYKF
jgi:hypothetical protein